MLNYNHVVGLTSKWWPKKHGYHCLLKKWSKSEMLGVIGFLRAIALGNFMMKLLEIIVRISYTKDR